MAVLAVLAVAEAVARTVARVDALARFARPVVRRRRRAGPVRPPPPARAKHSKPRAGPPPKEEARTGPTHRTACRPLAPALWSPRRRRVRAAPRAARPSPRRRRGSRRASAGVRPAVRCVVPVLAGGGGTVTRLAQSARGAGGGPARPGGGGIVARGAVAQVRRGLQVLRPVRRVRVRVRVLGVLPFPPLLLFPLSVPPPVRLRLKGVSCVLIV